LGNSFLTTEEILQKIIHVCSYFTILLHVWFCNIYSGDIHNIFNACISRIFIKTCVDKNVKLWNIFLLSSLDNLCFKHFLVQLPINTNDIERNYNKHVIAFCIILRHFLTLFCSDIYLINNTCITIRTQEFILINKRFLLRKVYNENGINLTAFSSMW
jgi:hypothetical protein